MTSSVEHRKSRRPGAKSAQPVRAWQRMLSGRRLDLLDPSPLDIEIGDIAHGLARVARWNGQTRGAHAFSVAQHSLIVKSIVHSLNPRWTKSWRRAALLHDAPEYVIGDLISPFKAAVGLDYKVFELKLLSAIHRRFAIPDPLPETTTQAIKAADHIAAYFEATVLAGFAPEEAARFFGTPKLVAKLDRDLRAMSPLPAEQANNEFLARFAALSQLDGAFMSVIHVCGLKWVDDLSNAVGPSHILSLLGGVTPFPPTPSGIDPANHLKITVADIATPEEGMITPGAEHVAEVIAFGLRWYTETDGTKPLLIHCFAGISRSTASTLAIACAIRPDIDESVFAHALRRASAAAQPNRLMIRHADDLLDRDGRLIESVEAIGEGDFSQAGRPYMLRLDV